MLGMYGESSIYFDYHDIRDIHGNQSEKGNHLQEIAIEDTIHTLDLDLSCCEKYIRDLLTVLALEFIARTGYHDIDRCVLVFAKIRTGHFL